MSERKVRHSEDEVNLTAGRYQIFLFALTPLSIVLGGTSFLCNSLLVGNHENISCQVSTDVKNVVEKACNDSWTFNQNLLTTPPNNNSDKHDQCNRYVLEPVLQPVDCSYWFPTNSSNGNSSFENAETKDIQTFNTTKCTRWDYHNEVFRSTVASEFNLVCENAWKTQIASLALMFGVLVGSILFGVISDRYGRKPSFLAATLTLAISEILSTIVRNFAVYCILQICIGSGFIGICTAGFIGGMEVLGSRHRVIAAQYLQCTFAIGFMLLALIGFLIPDWRIVGLISSIPLFVVAAIFWRIAHESPKWLHSKNRSKEANDVVRKIAKTNGKDQDLELLPQIKTENGESEKMIDSELSKSSVGSEIQSKVSLFILFKNSTLLKMTVILCYNWFAVSCIFYGLSFSATQLGGSVFLNLFFTGLVELPANCCMGIIMNYWGRRPIICVFHFLSGTALLCMVFVPPEMTWLSLLLFLIGKFGTTGAFGGVYLYTSELYPTSIRGNGLGCCSGFSRIGGMSAILIIMLGSVWKTLPYIVFGAISVVAGVLVGLLPETKNNGFPNTIEECEKMYKNRTISLKSQFFPCCRK